MGFHLSYAIRLLPHPAVTGAVVSAIMFGAARLVHGNWVHGGSIPEFEIATQAGVAAFCGFLVFALLSAVLRSVRFYEVLARSSRDMILVINDEGLVVEANDASLSAYGYTRDDFIGLHALRLVRQADDCPIRKVMNTGSRLTTETIHVRSDGTEFSVEASLTAETHYGRRVVLAVVRDITERKRRELFETLVHQVDRRILGGETLDSTLRFICAEVARAYEYALVQVSLKGTDGAVEIREFAGEAANFLASVNVRWDESPEGRGPTGTAIRTGIRQIRNLQHDDGFIPWREKAMEFGFKFAVAIPLRSSGDVLGALTFFSAHEITEDAIELEDLERFAEQIALSIVAVKGQEQVRLQQSALEATANGIVVTDAWGTILWVNVAFEKLTGYKRDEVLGKCPRILKSGRHGPTFYKNMWETLAAGRTWSGELYNKRKDGAIYLEEQTITPVFREDGEISHFVAIKQDISERRKQEERISFLALHDPLTELPNRKSFVEYLDRAVEQAVRGRKGTVLVTNIDNFKLVNDTMGHPAGDQLLRQFSVVLTKTFRPSDPVARIVGDEFAVLLEGATIEVAQVAADRLRRSVTGAGVHNGWEIPSVGLSIGLAEIDGSVDPEGVIRRAKVAVQAARASENGRAAVYSPELEELPGVAESGRMAMRIRNAIRDERFSLDFQKVVCLGCGRAEHYEALVRMIDETGERVFPDQFIPTAERFGLIREIDGWVVSRVIDRLANDVDLKVFVNLSGSSLTDDSLLMEIEKRYVEADLRPGQLAIEITEAAAVTDFVAAQQWIHRLKRIGCLFAIDDFGIGFSSLSYLQSLSVDFVKVDRSFVTDIQSNATNRAIVQAVQTVAASLGKEVIAEGIETAEHLETVRSLGIARGQGYHWGRPDVLPDKAVSPSVVSGGDAAIESEVRCRC